MATIAATRAKRLILTGMIAAGLGAGAVGIASAGTTTSADGTSTLTSTTTSQAPSVSTPGAPEAGTGQHCPDATRPGSAPAG